MAHQQPPVEDGPIPFFGAAQGPPPTSNRNGPPPRPLQQQQRPPFQPTQHHPPAGPFHNQQQPVQPQPQRHPQQHPQQMPPQHQQQQALQRPQPPRQASSSPFGVAADLFASPPTSNPTLNQTQNQGPPQGFQPQGGNLGAHVPAQHQPQPQPQVQNAPPRFPQQHSPVQQKAQRQPSVAQPGPPVRPQQQALPPQRPPVQQQQQQQQQPPVNNQIQRNPQQQQHQQHQQQQQFPQTHQKQQGHSPVQERAQVPAPVPAPAPAPAPGPIPEQTGSPFASASDLFGNATGQNVSGWSIPAAEVPVAQPAAPQFSVASVSPMNNAPPQRQQQQQQPQKQPPPPQQQQQHQPAANLFSAAPASDAGRPPLPPAPAQKQTPPVQVPPAQQSTLAPLPQRQPSLQSAQLPPPPAAKPQQQQQQQPPQQQQQSRQGSISAQAPPQGPPQGPPRQSPSAPGPHGPPQAQASQLPPLPRASISTPHQAPLTGPPSATSVSHATSPYGGHVPPQTPLLTAIQTPLMLPAQTPQAYQSSRTPYMGPLRNQFASTSQLILEPCPYSECGGENKPQAKFCSECGRSISTASRSATPSLGHYAEFQATTAPPMPSLDRMNSYSQEQNQPEQPQQPQQQQHQHEGTYTGYAQDDQSYQQQDFSQDQQQYAYAEGQQGYEQGYDQTYDPNYNQGYGDATYYDQNQQYDPNQQYDQSQQYYDPVTGQYIDYAQQEQAVPEPEPEPEPEVEIIDDPLDRAYGCPLIAFGFGGKIMTSFPRSVQRFDSASNNMVTKRYPGDLQLEHIKDIMTVDKSIATYPGPLLMDSTVQMKNKRKDVLTLIESKIKEFEYDTQDSTHDAHRVLIWKLFKVMFEQEGVLVGGAKVDEAVRSVLLSIPLSVYPAQPNQEALSPLRSSASLDVLQDILRSGDRTGAVRYAMSVNLWAHALVISSCVNKELWKEAVNGFVSQELTAGGGDLQANGREALRVLYALFSGQTQSAITELIPSTLRAPIDGRQDETQVADDQFVTGASLSLMKPIEEPKIPSASLGQWRDTLVMILSNRTSGDQTAISSLGDLLLKEGWVEAAHICYLLSPQNSVHSGPDAQGNRLVLIGADANPHLSFPFYKNVEAFQKTEIYEFACALRSAGATGGLPFLQAYKLIYVWTLVEWGMFSEAGRYLESMEAIVKSQTKGSPYYNIVFLERLKDITERLSGSSQLVATGESWFAKKVPKPTIGGIFDALDNKISKFIAGDNDQLKPVVDEPKANASESGPFANAPALPDLSNIPPRAVSRSSNGTRATRRTSIPGRASLEVPTFNQTQAVPTQTQTASQAAPAVDVNATQDQTYPGYAGYDQAPQYNAEGDAQAAGYYAGYEYDGQTYAYDSTQAYSETYQSEDVSTYHGYEQQPAEFQAQADASQEQQAYGEENYQTQTGYEGQYDETQYNGQYDAQYETAEGTPGATVTDLAIQPDNAPVESAHYSTQAVHGSEEHDATAAAAATATATATVEETPATVATEEYDANNYGQYAEGAEYAYTEDVTYNGDYQEGHTYQQDQEYQQEYQEGQEYQAGDYQTGEYTTGEYTTGGEYQQEYQQEYQEGQDYNAYGEQQYDQTVDQTQYGNYEGAEYNDASYQKQTESQQAVETHAHVDTAAPEKQQEVLTDEPTAEQQEQPILEAAAVVEPVAETPDAVQGEYQETEHQLGEYQEGQYQEGQYQEGQYDYNQTEYQQGEYHQETQYDYTQQGEYQEGQYDYTQQGEYQDGQYQEGQYDYTQTEYQQQDDYQQAEYPTEDQQQQQQPSNEPGVLPVTSEYQEQGEYDAAGVYEGHPNGAEYSADGTQQQDYSSGNNTWWGNGDGSYVDPNVGEQQPAADVPAAAADAAQEPLEENYEEGQFISFGAVPTIPSFGQPAAPVNNNNNQPSFADDDDLGMGNNSLKKEKPAVPEGENAAAAAAPQDDNAANAGAEGDDSKGWWPKISLFGGEKREGTPKPVKANLGEESSFYFDKEQQRWVNKKGGSETSSVAEALPPPPMSRTATPASISSPAAGGPPSLNRGPPSTGGSSPAMGGPPGPKPAGAGSAARRGARSRYVDVLNTN